MTKSIQNKYEKYIRTRLALSRFCGLLISVLCTVLIAVQYFKVYQTIWNAVSIIYLCGFLFTLGAQYLDLRLKKGAAKAFRVIAMLFYILTVALLVVILLDRVFLIRIL